MYYLIAFVMGLCIAMQTPINTALAHSLNHSSLIAAFISFLIGTVILFIFVLSSGIFSGGIFRLIFTQSWWKFLGGILGAFFVLTILLVPKIGPINMFLLALLGQLIMSTVMDNFGAFGLSVKHISLEKIIGIFIICGGLLVFFQKKYVKNRFKKIFHF